MPINLKIIVLRKTNKIIWKLGGHKLIPKKPSPQKLDVYADWRNDTFNGVLRLIGQYGIVLEGKRVLDFGCGNCKQQPIWVNATPLISIGVDINMKDLLAGRTLDFATNKTNKINRVQVGKDSLPFQAESIDVIFSNDVMEHVLCVDEIINEWYKILTPGGKVFVLYQQFEHPFAHHADRVLLLPWCHLFLSDYELRTLVRLSSNDLIESLGNDNGQGGVIPYINRLTSSKFYHAIKNTKFIIDIWELRPFRGKTNRLAPWFSFIIGALTPLKPYFSRDLICVLRKPE